MLVPLASSVSPVHPVNFYHALRIYHVRPHLINKKLCGVSNLFFYNTHFQSISNNLSDLINYTSLTYETNKIDHRNYSKDTLSTLVKDLLLPYDKNLVLDEISQEEFKNTHTGIIITVRLLLPKQESGNNTVEVVIFNYNEQYVQFLAASSSDKVKLVAPPFQYKFELKNNFLQLIVDITNADTCSGEWLADKLFPKILKWSEESNDDKVIVQSLSLVDVEQYFDVYRRLKEKYGKKMIDMWTENTDPLKFVYEDVAIASYLICLWNSEGSSSKKPSFLDLGCGNGLLVYILSEEGYPGEGIDVRKRKIWDLYPETTKLQIKTIVPSDENLFPDVDWIIGNHSDELTPWIPVIAARSSPKTNFFLLPCCCFNFDGTKYRRKNTGVSQYSEYLLYIEDVCNACGFVTKVDKLRIPSTKRTCLIGSGPRTISNEQINTNITKLLSDRSKPLENLKLRESEEKVRNCTKLDRTFITETIHKLVSILLTINPDDNLLLHKENEQQWNAGSCLEIRTMVNALEPYELKRLKNECGGLQTLMRNHRYIFNVDKGRVKLRPPYLRSETEKYVDKPCWFKKNHPDGCLYDDESCGYSHVAV